jgi:hypothetical protein
MGFGRGPRLTGRLGTLGSAPTNPTRRLLSRRWESITICCDVGPRSRSRIDDRRQNLLHCRGLAIDFGIIGWSGVVEFELRGLSQQATSFWNFLSLSFGDPLDPDMLW